MENRPRPIDWGAKRAFEQPRFQPGRNQSQRSEEKRAEPPKKSRAGLLLGLMLLVIAGGSVCFGGYFYWQYKKTLKIQTAGVASAQPETKALTDKLGKILDLPGDEEPTMAEVKDVEKLKGQLFFSSAQNGDKVLIYTKNKRAVLYRPGTDKVIEIASLGAKENVVIDGGK